MIMKFFPKVKCSRCDRSFPGLKNKCPHCGADRARRGKRASDVSDRQVRLIIRSLVLAALIITIISAIAIDLDEEPHSGSLPNRPGTQEQGDNDDDPEENGENGPGGNFPPPELPPPPPPTIPVTLVDFNWQFKLPGGANDITVPLGQTLTVWAEIFPVDADVDEIRWNTSDGTVANITIHVDDPARVDLLARGRGQAIITVTAGGMSQELIVRVS